jgi:hypothetical protein
MKLFLIVCIMGVTGSYLSAGELKQLQLEQVSPYDRCMASYDGLAIASQCELLKLKGE